MGKTSIAISVVAIVLIVGIRLWLQKDYEAGVNLPILGSINDFSLTERSGQTIKQSDLLGKVWVADFIFTRCQGPCPYMTTQMEALQNTLPNIVNLRFVSFSVDPEYDKPDVLKDYARRYGADGKRWLFLTGAKEDIARVATKSLHLALDYQENNITHDTHFVLFDRKGRIRGYYISYHPDDIQKLAEDVKLLAFPKTIIPIDRFPAMNASLNATSAVLLIIGLVFIKKKKITQHKIAMVMALFASLLFLVSYLFYHYYVGSVQFNGKGFVRTAYFGILISHTILAAVIVPLALITIVYAIKDKIEAHKKIAHWTFPIWLYVSVSGVAVYFMLYHS